MTQRFGESRIFLFRQEFNHLIALVESVIFSNLPLPVSRIEDIDQIRVVLAHVIDYRFDGLSGFFLALYVFKQGIVVEYDLESRLFFSGTEQVKSALLEMLMIRNTLDTNVPIAIVGKPIGGTPVVTVLDPVHDHAFSGIVHLLSSNDKGTVYLLEEAVVLGHPSVEGAVVYADLEAYMADVRYLLKFVRNLLNYFLIVFHSHVSLPPFPS